MRALRWALAAAVAGTLAWSIAAHPLGWLYGLGVHPYPASSGTPWTYQLWSGLVPSLAILSLIGSAAGLYRHANCRAVRCLRIGHYPDSRGVRWCWRHHPDHKGRKPTTELLHRLHSEHRDRAAAPPEKPEADMTDSTPGKPLPPGPHVPWLLRSSWRMYELATWPLTARALRQAGFRRAGWMTWESGPESEEPHEG